MENQLQIFNNPQFGEIRTAGTAENPLFCASDVARALGYANPAKAVIDHCKGVTVLETPTNGGLQPMKFIKEPEVYRLIFKSNAPNAEVFNSWLAEEVLPSIRKTGSYSIANLSRKELAMMVIQAEEEKERLDDGVVSTEPLQTAGGIHLLQTTVCRWCQLDLHHLFAQLSLHAKAVDNDTFIKHKLLHTQILRMFIKRSVQCLNNTLVTFVKIKKEKQKNY